jgi:uncharacterized protein (TIGR00288 family)
MDRVIVIIDGSNFYHKIKSLGISKSSSFNFKGLIKLLVGKRNLVNCIYYIGVIRVYKNDEKELKLKKGQLFLFNNLLNQNISIEKGFLLSDNTGRYHEKGVDVKMAVDLLIGAYEDTYDTAILLSSDTDLIPAIKKIREKGKNLEYIGFENQPSKAIRQYATKTRFLTKKEVEKFASK